MQQKNLVKKPILKKKIKGLKNSDGRNNAGKITIRHRGGGHKKKYRILDFFRKFESAGIVISLEYDPYRNATIASVYDLSKQDFFYVLAPKDLKVGDIIKSGENAEPKLGHCLELKKIPVGSFIHALCLASTKKAQVSRAAGTFTYLNEKIPNYAKLSFNSGEEKLIPIGSKATIGVVSNDLVFLNRLGKAGRSRWLNHRPQVRGVAMNPVDHPHGGGEGKKSGKGKTPWGKPTKSSSKLSKNRFVLKKNEQHKD